MPRAHACTVVVACMWVLSLAVVAQERTAEEVVEAIVRDGPDAAAIRAGVDVVRQEQQTRLVFQNPRVSYDREGAGFTEVLQVELPLSAFGLRGALTRAGVAATAAAEAVRDGRVWNLRLEATRLMMRWRWAQARVEAAAAATTGVERLVEVLRRREREGEGSRFDRLRGEQEVAELKQSAVAAAVELAEARGLVWAILPPGFSVTQLADLVAGTGTGTGTALDVEALVARAQSTRAELRALQHGVDHTALEAEAARRARWFVPVLSAGIKRADNGANRERGAVLGVNVAVPLFDTGSLEAARWRAEGVRMATERAAITQQVRAEIVHAAETLALREQAVAEAGDDAVMAELVAIAEVAHREGEMGIGVLLDAMRTASRGRQRELDREFNLRLAQVALQRAVGERMRP
jgi:outer membrane protein TolC